MSSADENSSGGGSLACSAGEDEQRYARYGMTPDYNNRDESNSESRDEEDDDDNHTDDDNNNNQETYADEDKDVDGDDNQKSATEEESKNLEEIKSKRTDELTENDYQQLWNELSLTRRQTILAWMRSESIGCMSFPHYSSIIRQLMLVSETCSHEELVQKMSARPGLLYKTFMHCRGKYPVGSYVVNGENGFARVLCVTLNREICKNYYGFPKENQDPLPDEYDEQKHGCIVLAIFRGETFVLEGNHKISSIVTHDRTLNTKVYCILLNQQSKTSFHDLEQFKVLLHSTTTSPSTSTSAPAATASSSSSQYESSSSSSSLSPANDMTITDQEAYEKWMQISLKRQHMIECWLLSEAKESKSFSHYPDLIRTKMELPTNASLKQLGKQIHDRPDLCYNAFMFCRGRYPLGKYMLDGENTMIQVIDMVLDRGFCADLYGYPKSNTLPYDQRFSPKRNENCIVIAEDQSTKVKFVIAGNYAISAIVTHGDSRKWNVFWITFNSRLPNPPNEGQFKSLLWIPDMIPPPQSVTRTTTTIPDQQQRNVPTERVTITNSLSISPFVVIIVALFGVFLYRLA